MARPKNRVGGLIRISTTEVKNEILKTTATSLQTGSWPGRPHPSDRMFDASLARICEAYNIPDVPHGLNPCALLEHEFVFAEEAIRIERQLAQTKPVKAQIRAQIEAIAKAAVGDDMPDIHDDVLHRLSFMAVMDRRYGNGNLSRLREITKGLNCQTVVTESMRDWAAWVVALGGTHFRSRRNHGGPHKEAELILVSVLINFWIDVLGREPATWVFDDDGDVNGKLTSFVRDCLHAVGARAKTRSHGVAQNRPLKLSDAHQRILRVKKEMEAAVELGLTRNYLARQLNRVLPPGRT